MNTQGRRLQDKRVNMAAFCSAPVERDIRLTVKPGMIENFAYLRIDTVELIELRSDILPVMEVSWE